MRQREVPLGHCEQRAVTLAIRQWTPTCSEVHEAPPRHWQLRCSAASNAKRSAHKPQVAQVSGSGSSVDTHGACQRHAGSVGSDVSVISIGAQPAPRGALTPLLPPAARASGRRARCVIIKPACCPAGCAESLCAPSARALECCQYRPRLGSMVTARRCHPASEPG
jgi:hypothetical protein